AEPRRAARIGAVPVLGQGAADGGAGARRHARNAISTFPVLGGRADVEGISRRVARPDAPRFVNISRWSTASPRKSPRTPGFLLALRRCMVAVDLMVGAP